MAREDDIPTPIPTLGLKRGAILFAMLWMTFAGVHHDEPDWNVKSRFALTQAIVDKGTFIVDGYVDREGRDFYTEDRAIYDGHYYSDKIIGASLLGLPAYALVKVGGWIVGDPASPPLARYLTTIGSIGVCAALAGTAMASILLALGATLAEALLLTLAMNFGTMLWGYSSLIHAYLPTICFFLIAYNILLRARLGEGISLRAAALSGLAVGAALLCEYTVGIVAVALSVYTLLYARPRWGVIVHGLCAAAVLSVFAVYTLICFHEICIPYKYLENPVFLEGMSKGLQGISQFRLSTLYYITVHPFRGVFVLSPILALSVLGVARMAWLSRRFRIDALMFAAIFAGYLLFNSSYYMWWGGYTMGPRQLIPGLPLMIPPLLWILRWNKALAAVAGLALAASIWLVAVPSLVDPAVPQGYSTEALLRAPEHFLEPDFTDPQALMGKLRVNRDPLTVHLRSRFSPHIQRMIQDSSRIELPEQEMRWQLVQELGRVLIAGRLYTEERFAHIQLDRRTRDLLAQRPVGDGLTRLNRMLIEQAYPDEIKARGRFYDYRSPVFAVCWSAFFSGGAAWNQATPYRLRGPAYFLILASVWTAGTLLFLRRSGAPPEAISQSLPDTSSHG